MQILSGKYTREDKTQTKESLKKAKIHHSGSAAMNLNRIAETIKNLEQQTTSNGEKQRTLDNRNKSNASKNRRHSMNVCSFFGVRY